MNEKPVKPTLYVYRATVVGVHDGDTVTLDIDLGFDVMQRKRVVRLMGINAPELDTEAGKASRDWLRARVFGKPIVFHSYKDKTEKYGRYLGELWIDDVCVNAEIVSLGHAKHWDGAGLRP